MKTFADIIKKSVLQDLNAGNITTTTILITLGVTCVLALYLFVVYYFATRRSLYSKSFNVALALIAVITASILLAMQSNLVISLGMVGALSIVRFRTAIKDPMDLMFLFWSISIGIICGAGMFVIAVITSLVITIGLFLLELTPLGKAASLLIVNCDSPEPEKDILAVVAKYSKMAEVKSRNAAKEKLDIIISCKPSDENALVDEVTKLSHVYGVSLLAHDGEVTL
ncbi:MAG: DUF4956 domain-containing protein [Lachnospiraceae bacterium]|nr:DUF4956 domain-containing protein [Lachnospiraceae bacterium]